MQQQQKEEMKKTNDILKDIIDEKQLGIEKEMEINRSQLVNADYMNTLIDDYKKAVGESLKNRHRIMKDEGRDIDD